jgi:hypothetical protein
MKEKLKSIKDKINPILSKIPTNNIYFKLVFIFIIFYSLVFFQIEKIERLMTFPGV